ncbi:hypothetical protein [Streptomyces sp. NPDC093261]|uniref:hypothetical protein n=1 Tax=Streptomyces sp. NPDC093261 TaxID=3366037 RepID=UPI00380911C8
MGLYAVATNITDEPEDLNQLVNLLTGVTTNTPMVVSNRITATLPGASAASAYAGGVTTTTGAPSSAGFQVGDHIVDTRGILWVYSSAGAWRATGCGGYTSRAWQKYTAQRLNRGFTNVYLDTWTSPGYDPRTMRNYGKHGFTILREGRYTIHGRVGMTGNDDGRGRATAIIMINGSERVRGDDGQLGTGPGAMTVMANLHLQANDLVQLGCWLNYAESQTTEAHMSVTWRGEVA